jgi:hypothetical protein
MFFLYLRIGAENEELLSIAEEVSPASVEVVSPAAPFFQGFLGLMPSALLASCILLMASDLAIVFS